MREKRRGYPAPVSVGYKKEKESSGKIKNMTPVWVKNIKDLEKIKEGKIGILGNIGKRKKIEIAKKAREMKIKFCNINVEKFIKENEKIEKDKEKTKSKEVKNESKKEERTNSQNS